MATASARIALPLEAETPLADATERCTRDARESSVFLRRHTTFFPRGDNAPMSGGGRAALPNSMDIASDNCIVGGARAGAEGGGATVGWAGVTDETAGTPVEGGKVGAMATAGSPCGTVIRGEGGSGRDRGSWGNDGPVGPVVPTPTAGVGADRGAVDGGGTATDRGRKVLLRRLEERSPWRLGGRGRLY